MAFSKRFSASAEPGEQQPENENIAKCSNIPKWNNDSKFKHNDNIIKL